MHLQLVQAWIAAGLTALIGVLTYLKCRGEGRSATDSNREFFLAGGGLSWIFVAGSITITNLSTTVCCYSSFNNPFVIVNKKT